MNRGYYMSIMHRVTPKKPELFLFGLLEVGELDGIFAREAGRAEAFLSVNLFSLIHCLQHAFEREVSERIRGYVLPYFVYLKRVGDKLLLSGVSMP